MSIFLYSKIAPKLQVHGLMDNEKIAGVRYRRAFVTRYGLEVLAECERRVTASKHLDNSKGDAAEPIEQQAAT